MDDEPPATPTIEAGRPLGELTGLENGFSRSFSSFFDADDGSGAAGLGIGRPPGATHSSRSPSASSEPWNVRPRSGSSDATGTTGDDSLDMDAQIANAVHTLAGPMSTPTPLPNDKTRNADELGKLLLLPGNTVCADCRRAGE
jgi:hypothetical protein